MRTFFGRNVGRGRTTPGPFHLCRRRPRVSRGPARTHHARDQAACASLFFASRTSSLTVFAFCLSPRFAVHALGQAERLHATNGSGRYSLWTGDVGTALFAAACLDLDARYPILDIV